MNTEPESKFSPFQFDVYACPTCANVITAVVYELIDRGKLCPQCGECRIWEYELRRGKEGK